MSIEGKGGAFHAKGARLELDRNLVALKFNGNFPGNPEAKHLPTIQGAILLCCADSGSLLAIMDSIEVTLRRTAAATALAARFLARPASSTVLVCGCGEQSAAQLAALRDVLPLTHVLAWDRDEGRARAFAREQGDAALTIEAVRDLANAASRSDVIITCTTSRTPFLDEASVRPGTFVAAVGADSPEKSEICPTLMRSARVVTDVLDQCAIMGDLHHALSAGVMTRTDVHAELAQLITRARPGRTSPEQITLFDSTGTALQDVAAAAEIYARALQQGCGTSIALGSADTLFKSRCA
jgi:ornithine cyclodeaminase/alanine dehydrogenase-like protein (mu-crystallin family)